jgi:hypothetical protein
MASYKLYGQAGSGSMIVEAARWTDNGVREWSGSNVSARG